MLIMDQRLPGTERCQIVFQKLTNKINKKTPSLRQGPAISFIKIIWVVVLLYWASTLTAAVD